MESSCCSNAASTRSFICCRLTVTCRTPSDIWIILYRACTVGPESYHSYLNSILESPCSSLQAGGFGASSYPTAARSNPSETGSVTWAESASAVYRRRSMRGPGDECGSVQITKDAREVVLRNACRSWRPSAGDAAEPLSPVSLGVYGYRWTGYGNSK